MTLLWVHCVPALKTEEKVQEAGVPKGSRGPAHPKGKCGPSAVSSQLLITQQEIFMKCSETSGSNRAVFNAPFTVVPTGIGGSCSSYGEGNGIPLQYSCLESPMDGGAWWAGVHGVAKSRAWLGDFPFTVHFHALEEELATHSSVLAWRIPGTEESSGLLSMGSHRVRHDWGDLAAAAAAAVVATAKYWNREPGCPCQWQDPFTLFQGKKIVQGPPMLPKSFWLCKKRNKNPLTYKGLFQKSNQQ